MALPALRISAATTELVKGVLALYPQASIVPRRIGKRNALFASPLPVACRSSSQQGVAPLSAVWTCGAGWGGVKPHRFLGARASGHPARRAGGGRQDAEAIKRTLVEQKMLDAEGRQETAFDPKKPDFKIELPQPLQELAPAVVDLLASYQIERHIRQDKDEGVNRLKKEVALSSEFQALWDRIKPKTTYRVLPRRIRDR